MEKMTLDMARKMIEASIKFAEENEVDPGTVAVVDEGGHLVAVERRDRAPAATVDIAIDKAWTAAMMKAGGRMLAVVTKGLDGSSQEWRLMLKHKGRITINPGALPVYIERLKGMEVFGGIGHCGGTEEDDLKVSQAGWASLFE